MNRLQSGLCRNLRKSGTDLLSFTRRMTNDSQKCRSTAAHKCWSSDFKERNGSGAIYSGTMYGSSLKNNSRTEAPGHMCRGSEHGGCPTLLSLVLERVGPSAVRFFTSELGKAASSRRTPKKSEKANAAELWSCLAPPPS